MNTKKWLLIVAMLGASLVTMMSCKKNNNTYGFAQSVPPPVQHEIELQNSPTLGSYLTDKLNHTLYFFSNDADGQDSCTGGCQAFWPVFIVDSLTSDKIGSGLEFSDFGSVNSAAGGKQITYKGWPLYSFAPTQNGANQQEAPGLTTGDGFANLWFVAKPDYSIMFANAQLTGQDGKKYKSDYTEGIGKTAYFTDGNGRALYTFSKDSSNKNKFTASDLSNNAIFPIYQPDKIVVPSILNKTDFVSIQVFGNTQITYKGWPLYHFGQDSDTRGSNKAISFPHPGVWPVAVKDIHAAP